jgi:uncharacterized repeat protein (TIGR01451 family)
MSRHIHFTYLLLIFLTPFNKIKAQIINEKLFADTEQKEGGRIDFQIKVSDGVIVGGRFLEKEGYVTAIMKLDTIGILKWTKIIPDSLSISSALSFPFIDSDSTMYLISDIIDEFEGKKRVFCNRLNILNGNLLWQKNIGTFQKRSPVILKNYSNSAVLIAVFPFVTVSPNTETVFLIDVNKSNGNNSAFNLPENIYYNYNVSSGFVVDNNKNIYLHSGTTLYKFNGNNSFKLLWSFNYIGKFIDKIYIDIAQKLHVLMVDNSDKLNFYKTDPLSGNILYSTRLTASQESFTSEIKESDKAIFGVCTNRYVGGGVYPATLFKFNKTSNVIEWDIAYSTDKPYSGIKSLDFDSTGFIYLTGFSSTGAKTTFEGDWTFYKINALDGSIKYKYPLQPDNAIKHEISKGMGIYFFGQKAFMLGQLQVTNRETSYNPQTGYFLDYQPRTRLAFIPFNPENGQISTVKYFSGNYQFDSKVEQIITSNDRIIVVKQKGLKMDIESYSLDKRLLWVKSLGANYRLQEPIVVVSPLGNIGLVAKGYSYFGTNNLASNFDSVVVFAFNKNGQSLWRKGRATDATVQGVYKDIFFNDADTSILQIFQTKGDNSTNLYKLIKFKRTTSFAYNTFVPILNRLEGNTTLNFLQSYSGLKWCSLNMTSDSLKSTNCLPLNTTYFLDNVQLSLPLHNNKMFFGDNLCNWAKCTNFTNSYIDTLQFSLINSQNGNILWSKNILGVSAFTSNVIKLTADKPEQYFYTLIKRADSVFMYKFNGLNGDILLKKFLFHEKQAFEIQDFEVSPSGDRLIMTGNISQEQYGATYKNTFLRIIDALTGELLSYEVKKGEVKGDNTIGRGIAFFSDNSFWIGGNIQKIQAGKAGVIYESKLSTQLKSISGRVIFDKNNDNLIDTLDIPLPNAVISASQSKSYAITDSLGYYTIYLNADVKDTISVNIDIKNAIYKPKSQIISTTDSTKNFLLSLPSNTQDLRISITEFKPPRRGFDNSYYIFYKNVGNTVINGNVRLQLYNLIPIISATPTLPLRDSISPYWNFTNLKPNEERSISVFCKADNTAPFGKQIFTVASIDPIIGDVYKIDNIDSLAQTIVGSYDPNDKQVTFNNSKTPPSLIDPNTELIYTIRFQNTGNYPADFVKVVDTLSDKLDVSTFRMIAASHNYTVAIRNKNALVFDFNPIYLPDSIRDEKGSHGFVKFAIKPKKTLTKDEAIKNTGFIYFDYNPAIVTNTVETANLKTALFTPSVSAGKLDISPNPTQNIIKVEIEDLDFKEGILSIYDLSGRLMMTKSISNKKGVVDVSHLGNGEYICTIKSGENKVFVSKFVKL